ncbi:MAG TPA: hypothetical protein VLX92_00140 [Kofleriaceae bacterium]|nr:hypothetical protein [Kofleriaceae bacterium]
MGIFSRLFKGGDGGPPDGDDGGEHGSDAPDTEPVEKADAVPHEDPAPRASAPEPVAPPLSRLAPAGSGPTAPPLDTRSIWAWPEPAIRRASGAPPPLPPSPGAPTPPVAPAPPAAKPVAESKVKFRDPTIVTSPPPAPAPPAPVPAPAPAPPAPAAPAPPKPAPVSAPAAATTSPAKRKKPDTIGSAVDTLIAPGDAAKSHGASTTADLAAVRRVFEEVAAVHVGQVRDVMLELRYGEADPAWMDATRPALRSLRAMAGQMELTELCDALDGFCAAVETSVRAGAKIDEGSKLELLRRYQKLIELIPQAFELDAERDRREPIIVEALLAQVEGVEKPTIDKLFAVGLGKLDALLVANAEDVAAVTGLRGELATAIVAQFRSYRATVTATVSAPDATAERQRLHDLLVTMSLQNDDFRRASGGWTEHDKLRKRELRKAREHTFQRIRVALARLGERDQLARLDKLPFDERITMLDKFLSAPAARS